LDVAGSPVMFSLNVTVIVSPAWNRPSVVPFVSAIRVGTGPALSEGATVLKEAAWFPAASRTPVAAAL
jgi:hypothetical protein